ncbi:multi-sensor signal transduction multi-kinase [Chondrocystis sp. NIES-4102]|nr:multi-sensor signal transduction multi-kinase [Chondrocystis sp. NIES-4102]
MLENLNSLFGYSITGQVCQSNTSLIYRGFREADKQAVILKVLKKDYPTPEQINNYKQEYQILCALNLEGVVKVYDLLAYKQTLILVVEDFGGKSLNFWLTRQQFTLEEFLEIALKICQSLGEIHAADIIHKDINPSNIVLNLNTKQLKIIDFGISTVLSQENPALTNPETVEGTLAYMSPEQTGRMNRTLDYRSDFYSLGATFYHLLTGKPPFAEAGDALELVHCHLAKQPLAIKSANIPQVVGKIIMKLMAKTAEDRYQSARGIQTDIEKCLKQLKLNHTIADFSLGQQDLCDRFEIPEKLYGRKGEIKRLLAAFERVAQSDLLDAAHSSKSEFILVTGYSGIGKSSLVREIYKPITAKRGYFISGKFDQFKRNVPYLALLSALGELVQLLLSENKVQLEQWREQILSAVGINGQLIIDVLPELELIIGKQPAIALKPTEEAQNRFDRVMIDLIKVFCSPTHPLVMFLDDLQWSDPTTLHLIELLLHKEETANLLFIGAYRDNEVSATHPLEITLEHLRYSGRKIEIIRLRPLLPEDLSELIADTLHRDLDSIATLSNLVLQKTRGNPFFVNQLLKTLYEAKAIAFNGQQQQWQWDLNQIEQMQVSENVVDLVTQKLQSLPQRVQQLLIYAAALGSIFKLKTLAIIAQQQPDTIFEDLNLAHRAKIIFPISAKACELSNQKYKFAHDRLQQAAYNLIPTPEKPATHLKIGRLLWQNTPEEKLSERILAIVDHFNFGVELVSDPKEIQQIAYLNLLAARKAKAAAAYPTAQQYIRIGTDLLPPDSWQDSYDLTYSLYFEAMETAHLATDFERAIAIGELILQFTTTLLEKIKVYKLRVHIYIARNQKAIAIDTGLKALEMLGVSLAVWEGDLPQLPTTEELTLIREMSDPYQLAAIDFLIAILPPVHMTRPELFPKVAITMLQLCLKLGKSALSSLVFGMYGLFLSATIGDLETAYHSGKLALNILDSYQVSELESHVIFLFEVFIAPGKEYLKATLNRLQKGISSGYAVGQLERMGYCITDYCIHLFLVENSLDKIIQQHQQYIDLLIPSKQQHLIDLSQIWQQLALNFHRADGDKLSLQGAVFDETLMLPIFESTNNHQSLFTYYLAKLILAYNFQDYQGAIALATKASNYQHAPYGVMMFTTYIFYQSLAILSTYDLAAIETQEEIFSKIKQNLAKMKYWAECAPSNFLHQYQLVLAEQARVLGNNWQAGQLYQQAIAQAKENGYLQQQALASELATRFYLQHGMEQIAQTYIKEAYYVYSLWQAGAKIADLQAQYPQFFSQEINNSNNVNLTLTTNGNTTGEGIDLTTLIKAYQAVAREISLDKLLITLMKSLIENAGAQRGYLILETEAELYIEASYDLNAAESPQVWRSPLNQSRNLARSIVNYVWRTRENVVIADATRQTQFVNDLYLEQYKPRSIICTPLIDRAHLTGVVYLENNLATNTFTAKKLKMVQMLSGLAAIAISHARLYNSLEQKVTQRTQELSTTLKNLQTTQQQLIESEKMAALGNLVAGVAHEINTPIGNSVTAASTLADETNIFNDQVITGQLKRSSLNNYLNLATEASEIILSNLQRAGELIHSFKQVAVDRTSLDIRSFALKPYLEEIFITLEPQLKKTPHQVIITGDSNIVIKSCPGVFAQIITNLITNSLIHAYPTNKAGKICLDIAQQSKEIIIKYQDDGCGISRDQLKSIFEPFFTTARERGGCGLGLHIVYNLVKQKLKGSIQVKSEVNLGTIFIISIPC